MASGIGKGESKTSPRRVTATERQAQALELRKAGATYAQIATQLGFAGTAGAEKAVKSALRKTIQEPADELRKIELERLDAATFAVWQQVKAGNFKAIDRLLKIMQRRAGLLGLDIPLAVAQGASSSLDALWAQMEREAAEEKAE